MSDFEAEMYQPCREWIANAVDSGKGWEEIKALCVNESEFDSALTDLKDNEGFPLGLNKDNWGEYVEYYKSVLIAFQIVNGEEVVAISKGGIINNYSIPSGFSSTWEKYKVKLNNVMGAESIANLQKSSLWILNHLNLNTRSYAPVKGLVTGSVQSGKTANMEGLVSMAADYDWNFFIILSGSIDNLRKQTRDRFRNDLCNSEGILWRVLDFTEDDKHFSEDELKLNSLSGSKNYSQRYLTVCLKNRSRLEKLIDWLYSDPKRTNKLRIIVIDDEADQASINTADITEEEEQDRCAINQMIVNLVNGRKSDGSIPNTSFQSMNYISYTATPYANVLNEVPGESLYPGDFICTLPESHEYFGAKVIFGNEEEEIEGFPIVRCIPLSDEQEIKKLHKEQTMVLPLSMKRAIAWFLCVSAVQRKRGYGKPMSMLIHTTANQNPHFYIYSRIMEYLKTNKGIIELCSEIYNEEIDRVTVSDLMKANPDYGFIDEICTEYPDFSEIEDEIKEIISDIRNIELGVDKELEYGVGIHLCVDNCKAKRVAEEGTFLRIAYPDNEKIKQIGKAPVFIVIGGNTLSRGLTIEGLVCTYFARTSNLADTLMQMARWFGYRKGYELLQRIWMTGSAIQRFESLTKVDMDLKREVERFMEKGISPAQFGPRIRNIPEIARFRITSKRKSQRAEYDDFDFCGDSYETTDFEDNDSLRDNIETTEMFVGQLNTKYACRKGAISNTWVWDGVLYGEIKEWFLSKYSISQRSSLYNHLPYFSQWMDKMNEEKKFMAWNVVIADGDNKERTWEISDGITVGMIERTKKKGLDWIDIGSLRSGLDVLADVDIGKLSKEQMGLFEKVCKTKKNIISERNRLGLEDKPLLLIYRIKKDGGEPQNRSLKLREKMNTNHDIIGISIVVSGDSIGESHAKSLRIKM